MSGMTFVPMRRSMTLFVTYCSLSNVMRAMQQAGHDGAAQGVWSMYHQHVDGVRIPELSDLGRDYYLASDLSADEATALRDLYYDAPIKRGYIAGPFFSDIVNVSDRFGYEGCYAVRWEVDIDDKGLIRLKGEI